MLPLIPPIAAKIGELGGGDGDEGAIADGARQYLEELQEYRSRSFPSSEEQDRELLRRVRGEMLSWLCLLPQETFEEQRSTHEVLSRVARNE